MTHANRTRVQPIQTAGARPPRTSAGLRDRPTGATAADADGPSCQVDGMARRRGCGVQGGVSVRGTPRSLYLTRSDDLTFRPRTDVAM